MVRRSQSIEVKASPTTLWQVAAAGFGDLSTWFAGMTESWRVDGARPGIGTAREMKRCDTAKMERLVERITDRQDGRAFTYAAETKPKIIRTWFNTWRSEPSGAGTRLT